MLSVPARFPKSAMTYQAADSRISHERPMYLHLHEKSKPDTPNTSPLYHNTLSSTSGKQTCGSNDGNCKGLTPNLLKGRDKKDQWEDKEADTYADDKEKELNSSNVKNQTPSLRSTKKRSLATPSEKSQVKGIKRGRFSSRLSSDEETETGDK
ncbi:MAG: hypothetical protein Q9205_007788 [Flavoplaca limonia]